MWKPPAALLITLISSQAACLIGLYYISDDRKSLSPLLAILILANIIGALAFWASILYIPIGGELLKSKGLWGIDLNKYHKDAIDKYRSGIKAQGGGILDGDDKLKRIPEACGVVTAFLYFVSLLIVYGCARLGDLPMNSEEYLAGALTVCFTTFLGFVDDVIDLRWRHRVWLPYVASIPLLVAYNGSTTVKVPNVIRVVFGLKDSFRELDFGWFFYLYMTNLAAFSSNTINIYAGINGLEAGQTFICNAFIIFYSYVELISRGDEMAWPLTTSLVFSVVFMYTCGALLYHNAYPADVFVGDTFTMLAGVHLAAVAIMGHFSKTLLLLMLPQILNFIISLPQLLHIIHCPRHRIPIFDAQTNCLRSSKNYTLINLTLELFGDMQEKHLANLLLSFQVVCGILGLIIRFSPVYNTIFI